MVLCECSAHFELMPKTEAISVLIALTTCIACLVFVTSFSTFADLAIQRAQVDPEPQSNILLQPGDSHIMPSASKDNNLESVLSMRSRGDHDINELLKVIDSDKTAIAIKQAIGRKLAEASRREMINQLLVLELSRKLQNEANELRIEFETKLAPIEKSISALENLAKQTFESKVSMIQQTSSQKLMFGQSG
jgi:hypothetical protein